MKFLISTLSLAASLAHGGEPVKVDLQTAKPGPVISRQIYGQFAEHLGTGIYEGLWVGPDSKIPNVRGWRSDVVGALKAIKVPVVRWPGGCFADAYHWKDGIGPRDQRPKRNNAWGDVLETNAVGTHEFFDLAEQLGTETYISVNVGTGTPQEMADWLEYLTADGDTTLAQQRRANGREKPWRVNYWGIGNETWGCGGDMRPQVYADLYRQWSIFVRPPKDNKPKLVASGGEAEGLTWVDTISKEVKYRIDGISHHHYSVPSRDFKKKGPAIGFPESDWISVLALPHEIDGYLTKHEEILDRNDPKKKLGIYFDEWGSWYEPEPGTNPGFLQQRNTLRDAVLTALHFHVFHRHADRVKMANIAQMVNVLQAMVITDKERMLLTPTYHVFAMHLPFQDATSIPVQLGDVPTYTLGKYSIPAVSVSAAKSVDGKLLLSLANTTPNQDVPLQVAVGGKNARAVNGQLLTAAAMDSENRFDSPDRVKPQPFKAQAKDGKLAITVPAKSVLVLEVQP